MRESYSQLTEKDRSWLKDLEFYQGEIDYFRTKLEGMGNSTKVDVPLAGFTKRLDEMMVKTDATRNMILKGEKNLAVKMELAHRMKVQVDEDHHSARQHMKEYSEEYKKLRKDIKIF